MSSNRHVKISETTAKKSKYILRVNKISTYLQKVFTVLSNEMLTDYMKSEASNEFWVEHQSPQKLWVSSLKSGFLANDLPCARRFYNLSKNIWVKKLCFELK